MACEILFRTLHGGRRCVLCEGLKLGSRWKRCGSMFSGYEWRELVSVDVFGKTTKIRQGEYCLAGISTL